MTRVKTKRWDVVDYLATDADRAAYLEAALEEGDPQFIAVALGDIARAKGMAAMAQAAGFGGGNIDDVPANANPDFATVLKVVRALGLQLHAAPAATPSAVSGVSR